MTHCGIRTDPQLSGPDISFPVDCIHFCSAEWPELQLRAPTPVLSPSFMHMINPTFVWLSESDWRLVMVQHFNNAEERAATGKGSSWSWWPYLSEAAYNITAVEEGAESSCGIVVISDWSGWQLCIFLSDCGGVSVKQGGIAQFQRSPCPRKSRQQLKNTEWVYLRDFRTMPRVARAVDIIDQLSTTFKICLCTMYIENFLDYPSQLY